MSTSPLQEHWNYHEQRKFPGSPLLLLSWEELRNEHIRKLIIQHVELLPRGKECSINLRFSHNVRYHDELRQQAYLNFFRALRNFPINKIHYIESRDESDFHNLNWAINEIFSDDGWRQLRLNFTQIKKRTKVVRTQLSNETHKKLLRFRDEQGLESVDVAVQSLLELWERYNQAEVLNRDDE
jgi:hypothetical protein